ncbi:MAG: SAM-dependent methyltransferase [Coxiella sp. (in: Bacteria)]|nr:MAG: SAM-dependent methyltransferase [Coxiella sp. (in: g-proteobacteria)]
MHLTDINWPDMQVYIADPAYPDMLPQELSGVVYESNNLFVAKRQQPLPTFALDTWLNPRLIEIESISDAVHQLQPHHDFWAPYIDQFARRTALIGDKLKHINLPKQLAFPIKPLPPIAQFTLLDKNTVLFATERDKKIPNGQFNFIEDKINPPNRAYLKLWEALSLLQRHPKPGDTAIDVGASPGGWTYVLQSLGAQVTAIDKAPLDSRIAYRPGVITKQQSAFSLSPDDVDHIDWFVGDIACYPDKLYRWLLPWIESGKVSQFIMTLKLQGEDDLNTIAPFQKIPNTRILHLQQNKHEVTLFHPFNQG